MLSHSGFAPENSTLNFQSTSDLVEFVPIAIPPVLYRRIFQHAAYIKNDKAPSVYDAFLQKTAETFHKLYSHHLCDRFHMSHNDYQGRIVNELFQHVNSENLSPSALAL